MSIIINRRTIVVNRVTIIAEVSIEAAVVGVSKIKVVPAVPVCSVIKLPIVVIIVPIVISNL